MKKNFRRKFWVLLRGYWFSEHKWRALGLLAIVVGLSFGMVYILVLINTWYNEFYNALQNYQAERFWPLIGKFTGLAFVYIGIAVYSIYLRQLLQLRWRTWMTERYVDNWLNRAAYYRLQVMNYDLDNPEQRIQADIDQFTTLTLSLLLGFLRQMTTLAAFAMVLWELSGVYVLPIGDGVPLPGYMLWFSLAYSVAGTLMAHRVGRKLIRLGYEQQKFEADFRFAMTRVRENGESIAFYGGEAAERVGFADRFRAVAGNFRKLMTQTKYLNIFANGYGQLAVIVPLIMAAPKYFGGSMQLGGLMQTTSAFNRVQDALSFFVDSYASIADLVAVTQRLTDFTDHLRSVENIETELKLGEAAQATCDIRRLTVKLPDGRVLLADCSLSLASGDRLLITGGSGAGKSTLLRTLAGLWPFAAGKILRHSGETRLFLPQRPYLPLGSLRRAISYPLPDEADTEKLRRVLALVDMAQFADKLDAVDDWSRILSLGEQQRIAFARVLLTAPQWLFLDEATSALDEAREKNMYELIRRELPNTAIISVGHRSTLFGQHERELHLNGDAGWVLREIPRA